MKLGALLLLSALLLHAQTTFEIRGNVSEPGLGGIAGAEVRASNTAPGPAESQSVFTDGRGDFVFRTTKPGRYFLQPLRDGYGPAFTNGTDEVTVDLNRPSASAQLSMVRPAEVVGRVLDADTRDPIEGAQISVVRKRSGLTVSDWQPALMVRALGTPMGPEDLKSKKDGTFAIKGFMPGEYSLLVTLQPSGPTWSVGYSAEDLKIVDQMSSELRPGGATVDLPPPIPVGSGGLVSFGDILLKKEPHYRAHVSLEQGSCPAGEAMRLTLFPRLQLNATPQAFPCGSELLLRGLQPGTYYLYGVSDWQGERENVEGVAWATAQFTITDENVEIAMTPQSGLVLEGQLIAAQGFQNMPTSFPFGVQPADITDGFRPAPEQFIEALADGKFRMAVSTRPQTLLWRGSRVYVKQLRYNGVPLPNLTLAPGGGSPAHRLEIVLDDNFGALTGTVTGGGKPVSQAFVLLWDESTLEQITLPAIDGTFRMDTLAPHEYRAVGVRVTDIDAFAFGSFTRESIFTGGAKVGERLTIRSGETTTIQIPLSLTR